MHGGGHGRGMCGGSMHGRGACVAGWTHAWQGGGMHDRGHAWWEVCVVGVCMAEGACMVVGMHDRGACVAGAPPPCMAGETTTEADGTHPTGMHSCLIEVLH